MTTLTGKITSLTIGGSPITNCKYLRWRINHTVSPRLLPSSKIPLGWLQGHIWLEGEFGLTSYDTNVASPSTADANVVSFVATAITTAGVTRTFTFTGTVITSVDKDLGGDEPVFVYHFLAYNVTES